MAIDPCTRVVGGVEGDRDGRGRAHVRDGRRPRPSQGGFATRERETGPSTGICLRPNYQGAFATRERETGMEYSRPVNHLLLPTTMYSPPRSPRSQGGFATAERETGRAPASVAISGKRFRRSKRGPVLCGNWSHFLRLALADVKAALQHAQEKQVWIIHGVGSIDDCLPPCISLRKALAEVKAALQLPTRKEAIWSQTDSDAKRLVGLKVSLGAWLPCIPSLPGRARLGPKLLCDGGSRRGEKGIGRCLQDSRQAKGGCALSWGSSLLCCTWELSSDRRRVGWFNGFRKKRRF